MPKIIILFLFFILLLLQLTIMPRLSIFNVFPNILLAAMLIFVVIRGGRLTLFLGLAAGLLMDLFSSLPFGTYSLSFILVAWLAQFIGRNVFKITDLSGQVSLIALGSFFCSFLVILIVKISYWLGLYSYDFSFWFNFIKIVLPEFILNFLLTLILLLFVKAFRKAHGLFIRI